MRPEIVDNDERFAVIAGEQQIVTGPAEVGREQKMCIGNGDGSTIGQKALARSAR